LAFLLSGVLVGNFSPVVFIFAGSMGNGWEDLSVGSRIAAELVGDELPRRLALLSRLEASLPSCTNVSRCGGSTMAARSMPINNRWIGCLHRKSVHPLAAALLSRAISAARKGKDADMVLAVGERLSLTPALRVVPLTKH